jgi:hypothetical protein
MNKQQSGFAVVESLLILVIVAIIGGTGWFVWHSKQQTDKTLSETGNSQSVNPSKKTPTTVSTSTSQKYLTIKEWSVKVPLTSADPDAYYVINADRPDTAYLSLQKYKGTECAADNTSIGAYFRFTKDQKDDLSGNTLLSENPGAPKVGNYYFGYIHAQAACSVSSDSAEPTQGDVDASQPVSQAFAEAIGHVQAE